MPKRNPLLDFDVINPLLDLYGKLLTKHQQTMMSDYYRFNLSLKEIAEQRGISRAAVSDAITQAKHHFQVLEASLHVQKMRRALETMITEEGVPDAIKEKIKAILNRERRKG
jgi:predicted DNA-binding protein YlxM (UPF0122 family)